MSEIEAPPIADLSYRNYDGPKTISGARWWPIARNTVRLTLRKKAFWLLCALAWLPYLIMIFQLLISSLTENNRAGQFIDLPKFSEMLSSAYGSWQWILFIALLSGAGAIAADNRANALQIYLSKSLSKGDYLFGKWLGIFIILFAVVWLPMFVVSAYAAFNLGFGDFIKANGWLFLKLPVIAAIPAVVHASVICGVSAWNKSPMIAGLIYSAIFMAWNIFVQVMGLILQDRLTELGKQTLSYFSLQGAISGLGQNIIGIAPRSLLGDFQKTVLPSWPPLLLLGILFCVVGLAAARARIRAVEVVQG